MNKHEIRVLADKIRQDLDAFKAVVDDVAFRANNPALSTIAAIVDSAISLVDVIDGVIDRHDDGRSVN